MKIVPFLAGVLSTLLIGLGVQLVPSSSPPGSSAKRTIYSFVHAAKGQNYGRACSYMTRDWAGNLGVCVRMENVHVVAGSERIVDENTVTYLVVFDDWAPPSKITVTRQANGKWRITEVA